MFFSPPYLNSSKFHQDKHFLAVYMVERNAVNKMMMKFSFCFECAMKLSFHFIVKSEGLVYDSKMCQAQWPRHVITAALCFKS